MEDRCVCCGACIPEGQMVCKDCLEKRNEHKKSPEKGKQKQDAKCKNADAVIFK